MPTYDFICSNEKCDNHNHSTEERVSFADRDKLVCPACGSPMVVDASTCKPVLKGVN